jgi:hypothetical protein
MLVALAEQQRQTFGLDTPSMPCNEAIHIAAPRGLVPIPATALAAVPAYAPPAACPRT